MADSHSDFVDCYSYSYVRQPIYSNESMTGVHAEMYNYIQSHVPGHADNY